MPLNRHTASLASLPLPAACSQDSAHEALPRPIAAAPERPVLARADDDLSADETRLADTIAKFYRTLGDALAAPEATGDDAEAVATHLAQSMQPLLEPVRRERAAYDALDPERRRRVQHAALQRHPEELTSALVATSRFTERFRDPSRTHEFRPIVRRVFEPWLEADAMWVFDAFGQGGRHELEEWTEKG